MKQLTIPTFRRIVWEHYANAARDLPWREVKGANRAYCVLVSEFMLQQTQVSRVLPKYHLFLRAFPSLQDLAMASSGDVLKAWSGLGYNRRALYLWKCAKQIVELHGGIVPHDEVELQKLPGIGKNTAAAIVAYAWNRRAVYIETNIRTVFLHHFFPAQEHVPDAAILPLVEKSLPREKKYSQWYSALMDYGTHIRSTHGAVARRSAKYVRQSAFQGSLRQVRGAVIRSLTEAPKTFDELERDVPDPRLSSVLVALEAEGMILLTGNEYRI